MWHFIEYVAVTFIIVVPVCFVISWLAYMIHCDSRGEVASMPNLPRLFPWSVAARLRRKKMEVDLVEVDISLLAAQHTRMQKQMILEDLENHRLDESKQLVAGNGHIEVQEGVRDL
jgi:hypothetical protein